MHACFCHKKQALAQSGFEVMPDVNGWQKYNGILVKDFGSARESVHSQSGLAWSSGLMPSQIMHKPAFVHDSGLRPATAQITPKFLSLGHVLDGDALAIDSSEKKNTNKGAVYFMPGKDVLNKHFTVKTSQSSIVVLPAELEGTNALRILDEILSFCFENDFDTTRSIVEVGLFRRKQSSTTLGRHFDDDKKEIKIDETRNQASSGKARHTMSSLYFVSNTGGTKYSSHEGPSYICDPNEVMFFTGDCIHEFDPNDISPDVIKDLSDRDTIRVAIRDPNIQWNTHFDILQRAQEDLPDDWKRKMDNQYGV